MKFLHLPEPEVGNAPFEKMWLVPDNISVIQRGDETLMPLFAKVLAVIEGKYLGKDNFFIENDV